MKKTQAYIMASRHYLTDELPGDWENWEEDQLLKFVEDHTWQPFEWRDAEDVWEYIELLAADFEPLN